MFQRRTAYSSAKNSVIPTPTSLAGIVPRGAWVIILPIKKTDAIRWSYTSRTIENCPIRALTSGITTLCRRRSARVIHVLTGFFATRLTWSVNHVLRTGRRRWKDNCFCRRF